MVIKRNAEDEKGMFGLFLHDQSGGGAKVQRIDSEVELRASLLKYGVTDAYADDKLPTFPGDPDGTVHAINDRGEAAGVSGNCTSIDFFVHALVWQRTEGRWIATDLGNLGGSTNNVWGINNQGQVVGASGLPGDKAFHAFLWENGIMTDLGTLPGDASSEAFDVSSKGQVVGGSFDAEGNGRAFLWQDGVMTDLNPLIPADSPLFLFEATGGINSHGQIAGFALQKSTGNGHAFLATPIGQEADNQKGVPPGLALTSEKPKVALPENVRQMLRQERLIGFLRR